jgi:hypothetical protein
MTLPFTKSLLCCTVIAALLTACGGGGGGGSSAPSSSAGNSSTNAVTPTALAPTAPVASLSFGTDLKTLQFAWAAVTNTTHYRVVEDVNGSGSFAPISADLTTTSFAKDIAVSTQDWANARYQVQACNSTGCTASTSLQPIGYFKASNTGSGDSFGWTLALSRDGDTLAVGAPFEDSNATGVNKGAAAEADNSAIDSGAVYVFTKSGNGWTQAAYIKASNASAGSNFGESISLNGDGSTLVIGAPFADNAGANDTGALYVFSSTNGTWAEQAKLTINSANSYLGWAVAVSGDGKTLAGGAPGDSTNAGAAYVFKFTTSWVQQPVIKASNAAANSNFGTALALNANGSTLAIGAPYESTTGVNSGAVYIYTSASNGSWSEQAFKKALNAEAGDNFGAAVALDDSGNTLAVGAPYEASNATGIGGNAANNFATDAGAAYLFTRTGANWSQQAYVKASNTAANDDFGSAVALSGDGNVLAVGAIGESSTATGIDGTQTDNSKDGVGAAYLFKNGAGGWAQTNYIKPSTATLGDEFGSSIGLSNDGTTMAISGAFERSAATGIGGSQTDTSATDAGALWLF